MSDASVFENRTANVVFLTCGSEAQKITPHMAQKSKKKLDVISEAFLTFITLFLAYNHGNTEALKNFDTLAKKCCNGLKKEIIFNYRR